MSKVGGVNFFLPLSSMDISNFILPDGLLDLFEIVNIETIHKRYDIHLDERPKPPSEKYSYSSKGFTEAATIQDFPIRGHAVYLHVRRRKWLEHETGKVLTTMIDLSHVGTGLTEEFASFLKKIGLSPAQYL